MAPKCSHQELMNSLSLRFEPDPEDTVGRLILHVATASFEGSGFQWAQPSDLDTFVTGLSAYPITAEQPAVLHLGYGASEGDDMILGVKIAPANGSGHLLVRVEIADLYEQDRLCTSFVTTYAEVDIFRRSVELISQRGEGEATLLAR